MSELQGNLTANDTQLVSSDAEKVFDGHQSRLDNCRRREQFRLTEKEYKAMRSRPRLLLAISLLAFGFESAFCQDPVKVAPNNYKVLLENDQVRVSKGCLKPGETIPMHSHPYRVIYELTDQMSRFTFPAAQPIESHSPAGEVKWGTPVTHSEENIGKTEGCALIVELKGLGNSALSAARSSESRGSWEKLPSGFYATLLENADARVLRACLKPGETIPMHSYRFPRVVYYLTGHTARFTSPSTPPVESHSAAGEVRWVTTRAPHSEENTGKGESCALIIELRHATGRPR